MLLGPSPAFGYSRRLRTPLNQQRYLVQSLTSVDKNNFNNLQCNGMYHKAIFSKLDTVCDDCYDLYKEPEIHSLCRLVEAFLKITRSEGGPTPRVQFLVVYFLLSMAPP